MNRQFGAKISQEEIAQYEKSPNFKDGHFHNILETKLGFNPLLIPVVLYKQIANRKKMNPPSDLPLLPFDPSAFLATSEKGRFCWFGHSALLMRLMNTTIFIDPMMGPNSSPIAPFKTERFSKNTLDMLDELPAIDLIVLTHDHYDHLDLASMETLSKKTKQFFVALGVKRHLVSWGIDPACITEFDWWQEAQFEGITITFTPTRHFAGRGLRDRNKSFWGGWAFQTKHENIWFSGDGGYGSHFKEIGKRLGPFDLAFMECGQYNDYWKDIHLFPHESVQAGKDGRAQKIMPVHWAGFALSFQHTWQQPAEEFTEAARAQEMPVLLPRLGQLFQADDVLDEKWWREI